ncbi:MAG: hypothetical protein RI922_1937 [Bacteroidota bacterium]|jgi:AraC family transcriptional regulator
MEPRIEQSSEKKLIGQRMTMSFANYSIALLWQGFMPRKHEIQHKSSEDLFSLVKYQPTHFTDFKPSNEFERWACMEVSSFDHIPEGMESFVLPSGLCAVFSYKGLNTDNTFFNYIFETWLPSSVYELDDRPHFERLGEKYKNNDPNSEEEIWIPVKLKSGE